MVLTNITGNGVASLTNDDLEDGLSLTYNYRAYTSFLTKLEKLIHFDTLKFECVTGNGVKHYFTTNDGASNPCTSLVRYFANVSPTTPRPSCDYCRDSSFLCSDIKDNRYSSDSVSLEMRPLKNVVIRKDNEKMSFVAASKRCFGGHNDYTYLRLMVK